MTTPEEMQAHVDSLVEQMGVKVNWHRHPFIGYGCASFDTPIEAWMPRVKDWRDYLTCLHELGHAAHRHARPALVEKDEARGYQYIEAQAWSWAFSNSIIPATLEMRAWAFETDDGGGLSSYDFTKPPTDPDALEFVGNVRDYLLGVKPGMVTA